MSTDTALVLMVFGFLGFLMVGLHLDDILATIRSKHPKWLVEDYHDRGLYIEHLQNRLRQANNRYARVHRELKDSNERWRKFREPVTEDEPFAFQFQFPPSEAVFYGCFRGCRRCGMAYPDGENHECGVKGE